MARATLAELIARVRGLIADTSGASQVFGDDEIEAALDEHRTDVRYEELEPVETLEPTGTTWLGYYSRFRWWEGGAVLQAGAWATLAPASAELSLGRWHFAASQNPPVYATGNVFDVYAAAADLLDRWAAKLKLDADFTLASGRGVQRRQKIENLRALAAEYRGKAQAVTYEVERGDCGVF